MILVLTKEEKMGETLNVNPAAIFLQNKIINILHLPKSKKKKEGYGKESTERNVVQITQENAESGTKGIWNTLENYLLRQLRDTFLLKMVKRKGMKDLQNGIKITVKKHVCMIKQCMLLKQENFLDQLNVVNAGKYASRKLITKIIQNLLKLFGSAQNAILIYITDTNITVNDLASGLQMEMRKSHLPTKAEEGSPKREPRQSYDWSVNLNWLKVRELWQAGGKAKFIYRPPGYGEDPAMLRQTAAAVTYQGQAITNDLWVQNLRSTGI